MKSLAIIQVGHQTLEQLVKFWADRSPVAAASVLDAIDAALVG